jgi:predicted RNase H-like nuclease
LAKRRHRGLARRLVAVRRRAVFVVPERERPHPRRSYWRSVNLEDAADDNAIGKHVEIVIVSHSPEGREVDARLRTR